MIQISNLTKRYGFNLVLRGINLHVKPAEFVTLVGPNGAGKSTLLRIVATLLKAESGQVLVGGWPLPEFAQKVRRYIGLVSHQSLLYSDLTAAENLEFFAGLYGLDQRGGQIQAALKMVGLTSRQRDPVRTFSRGMLQRLTIARATLHKPDILLLDEPYSGLDQAAATILDELLMREKQNGRTILMITHDLRHAFSVSDRLLILDRGKIARELNKGDISRSDLVEIYEETTKRKKREPI